VKDISSVYADNNKLLKLVKVINKYLVATDEMGSVRLFPYPFVASEDPGCRIYV